MTTLFKRAYVRGLNDHLVRTGQVSFPSKEAADYAADYVADHSGMPDPATESQQITLKVAHVLCEHLHAAGEALCKQAGSVDQGLAKTASAVDPVTTAHTSVFALMQKIASENTLSEAAKHDDGAKLDQHNRPAGYAHTGVGGTMDKGKGAVGTEEKATRDMPVSGSNSVTEHSKAAFFPGVAGAVLGAGHAALIGDPLTDGALRGAAADIGGNLGMVAGSGGGALAGGALGGLGALALKRPDLAEALAATGMLGGGVIGGVGGGVAGGMKGWDLASDALKNRDARAASKEASTARPQAAANDLPAAAHHDDGASLDMSNRGPGYAVVEQGDTTQVPSGTAVVGKETPAERDLPVSGSNSATALSKSAMAQFRRTAKRVAPFLPPNMPAAQKAAHVQAMMALGDRAQAKYLNVLAQGLGFDKQASVTNATAFLNALPKFAAEEEADEDAEIAAAMEDAAETLENASKDEKPCASDEKNASARIQDALARITGTR